MIESDVSAIVLAAGTSSRMGRRNKLLALFQNKPLVLHVVDQLAASRVGEIVVVLGHEAEKIFDVLSVHKKTLRPLVPKSPRTCSPLPSFPRRRESKKCAPSADSRLPGCCRTDGQSFTVQSDVGISLIFIESYPQVFLRYSRFLLLVFHVMIIFR